MPAQNGYGYATYYQPPRQKPVTGSLATAASGTASAANPFGLSAANGMRDAQGGYGATAPVRPAAPPVAKPSNPAPVAPTNVQAQQAAAPSSAPTPGGYDINVDPQLQNVTALTGLSDEQANATALKQRQQQVLAYGDQGLAAAALGASDPTVQATAQNPNSTVAQIHSQYQTNLHNLDEQLNQANLLYSGYRVNQEGQAATDEQNQLANAAAGVQGNLDTIGTNLSSALGQNQAQRLAAANDAANRLAAAAAAAAAQKPAPPPGETYQQVGVAPQAITSDEVAPPILPGPGPGPGTLPTLAAAASDYPTLNLPNQTIAPASAPYAVPTGALSGGSATSAPTLDFSALNTAAKKKPVSYASRALL